MSEELNIEKMDTIIAFPNYQAAMTGVSYIRLSARKVTLHYTDSTTESAFLSQKERDVNAFGLIEAVQTKARKKAIPAKV